MSIFWSSWITVLTLACWLAIFGVLLFVLRIKPDLEEDGTTGHIYDDVIKEYDKPLPKWWVAVFFGSLIWGIGYFVFFPAILPHAFDGIATVEVEGEEVPWSSKNSLMSELESNDKVLTNSFNTVFLPNPDAHAKLETLTSLQAQEPMKSERSNELQDQIQAQIEELGPYVKELASSSNPQAFMAGQNLFLQNCALCHGSTAQGAPGFGYPNLTDDDWLHGGEPKDILLTLHNGRHANLDPDAPLPMPAQKDDIGEEGIRAAAEYVLSISKHTDEPELDPELVAEGEEIFNTKCFICHGEEAKGMISAGAPNLTDGIWLYGDSREDVRESIRYGRGGVMPEWETKLGNERIMLLAAYVYSISNDTLAEAAVE